MFYSLILSPIVPLFSDLISLRAPPDCVCRRRHRHLIVRTRLDVGRAGAACCGSGKVTTQNIWQIRAGCNMVHFREFITRFSHQTKANRIHGE
jgi:hypothetical protein